MGMRTTKRSITAENFEKVFVRSATKRIGSHATTKHPLDWTDWRDIARKALHNRELGDALRNAVLPLPAKYREVLFLRDVKNLDTEETAWILGIAGGAAKVWLSRAGSRSANVCAFAETEQQVPYSRSFLLQHSRLGIGASRYPAIKALSVLACTRP